MIDSAVGFKEGQIVNVHKSYQITYSSGKPMNLNGSPTIGFLLKFFKGDGIRGRASERFAQSRFNDTWLYWNITENKIDQLALHCFSAW